MDGSQIAVLVAIIVVILLAVNSGRGRRSAGKAGGAPADGGSDGPGGDTSDVA